MLTSIITPVVLSDLIQEHPDVRLLDVRTPGEFESAHIRGAYNVPLDTLPEHTRETGMSNLHVLEGGVNGWMAAGFDTVRGRKLGYNRPASCDPAAAVRLLTAGPAPVVLQANG